jgi:uncharacterized membrane protein YfcA
MTYVLASCSALVAGVLAGMFGVGGGILFVPTLVALGLDAADARRRRCSRSSRPSPSASGGSSATATSAGARPRDRRRLDRRGEGGAPGRGIAARSTLRKLFAALLVVVAGQIAWRARAAG